MNSTQVFVPVFRTPCKISMFLKIYDNEGGTKDHSSVPVEKKRCTRLPGCGISSMLPNFKIELLIYQTKVKVDGKFFFGKITLDPKIKKMLVRGMFGNNDSLLHSGPEFTCY